MCVCACVHACKSCTWEIPLLRGRKTESDGEARESFLVALSGIICGFTDQKTLFQHSLNVDNKPVICRWKVKELPTP